MPSDGSAFAPPARGTGILRLFIRHPNAANLLMVLLILFGVFSLARINTQFFPTVERPTIRVSIGWSGASAEDVETNILAVVEPELRFLDGVEKIRSTARENSGSIALEFREGADMQKALSDVDTAMKGVSTLPQDADTPVVQRSQFFDSVGSISVSGTAPEAILRDWAKRMRNDLIARGIDKIDLTGLRDEELLAEIPERELRRLGLTISDVSAAVSSNSRNQPSGTLSGGIERQVRALADVESPQTLGQVEVRSFPTGEKVFLRDIADIGVAYEEDATRGFSNGEQAIELEVRRAATADTLATAAILKDYVAEIRPQLPDNVRLQILDLRSDALQERIMLLVRNGAGGLVLVMVTLFLFLNARVALWVAAGIPIAFMATLGMLYALGESINMISLFALIMMLGVIVDDAIVVGEHTDTRLHLGDDPVTAAENGAGRMVMPIFASMLTTIAAFLPMLLIGDTIGQIMRVLPIAVVAVIVASLVECFLILPGHLAHAMERGGRRHWSYLRQMVVALIVLLFLTALASRSSGTELASIPYIGPLIGDLAVDTGQAESLPVRALVFAGVALALGTLVEAMILAGARLFSGSGADPVEGGWFRRRFDRGFNRLRDGPFRRLVAASYYGRYITLAVAAGLVLVLAVGLLRGGHVKFVFFPSPEAESISGSVIFNAGTPEDVTVAAIARIESALFEAERELTGGEGGLVRTSFVTLGSSGRAAGDNLARISIQLTPSEERSVRTPEITRAWRDQVPDIAGVRRFSVFEARGGPPGRDVDILLQGGSAAALKAAAQEVIAALASVPGVSGLDDDLPYGKPELAMELTPRGAALGFSIEEVGRQTRNALQGAVPRRFARGEDEIAVRLTQKMRSAGSGALRNFELRSPSGEFVPLTEVVTLTERQGFSEIRREDGKSTLSVAGDIDSAVSTTDEVVALLEETGVVRDIAGRHGISYRYGGRSEERRAAFADLGLGAGVALAVIYIILAWVFGSYFRPVAVMLIIPLGLVGAVFGHWVMGYHMTILSMIGLLGLGGILVNNSIILVARLEDRLATGEALDAAVIGATQDRFRAVLLTSLTTIGGLLPLLYEKSLQAQFLLPMAITMVFGLALATVLVLFLVPALIGIGDDIARSVRTVFGRRPEPAA